MTPQTMPTAPGLAIARLHPLCRCSGPFLRGSAVERRGACKEVRQSSGTHGGHALECPAACAHCAAPTSPTYRLGWCILQLRLAVVMLIAGLAAVRVACRSAFKQILNLVVTKLVASSVYRSRNVKIPRDADQSCCCSGPT
jgi:hypothetical protein